MTEHSHSHRSSSSPETRILAALLLTIAGMIVSILGGIAASSLALLSDAGHMLADAAALGLALVAQRVASRPRTGFRTYGWRRAETLAAFVNAILLGMASVWVVIEAAQRWQDPPDVKGGWMLAVAVFGLLVNLVAAAVLSGGQRPKCGAGDRREPHAVSFRRNGEGRAALSMMSEKCGRFFGEVDAFRGHRRPGLACKPLKFI